MSATFADVWTDAFQHMYFWRGFFMGLQVDSTDDTTECYTYFTESMEFMTTFVDQSADDTDYYAYS